MPLAPSYIHTSSKMQQKIVLLSVFCICQVFSGNCPEGWVDGYIEGMGEYEVLSILVLSSQWSPGCLKLDAPGPYGWSDSLQICSDLGARLVELHSEMDADMIYTLTVMDTGRRYWTGNTLVATSKSCRNCVIHHRSHGPGWRGGVEVAGIGGAGGGLRLDLRCVDHSQ